MIETKLPTPANSICILRLSALGDITHMLPVVRTLQSHWPDCQITWVIGKTEFQLVQGMENIEFIIFDKSNGWKAYQHLFRQLRGRRFDILLHMQAALRASLASLVISAPVKVGFDRKRAADFQWLFSNRKIKAASRQHVLDGFFGFLQAIGIQEKVMQWNVPIPDKDKRFASQYVNPDQKTLVLNPSSSVRKNNYRNWRVEHYAKVVDHATCKLGLKVILTGGPASNERQVAHAISELCTSDPVDLTGKTTIKQMLAIVQAADIIMAPDTGPAHMGTAVGTPVIGLYVTSNPLRTGPYNDLNSVVNLYPEAVQQEFGCSEAEIRWGKRVRNESAVDLISVEAVIKQLERTLQLI